MGIIELRPGAFICQEIVILKFDIIKIIYNYDTWIAHNSGHIWFLVLFLIHELYKYLLLSLKSYISLQRRVSLMHSTDRLIQYNKQKVK